MFSQAFHRHKPIRRTRTHLAMVSNTKTQSRSYAGCEIRSSLAIDFESKLVGFFYSGLLCCEDMLACTCLLLCKLSTCCTRPLGQDHPKILLSLPIDEVKGTCNRSLGRHWKQRWLPTYHLYHRAKPSREMPSVSRGSASSPDPRS